MPAKGKFEKRVEAFIEKSDNAEKIAFFEKVLKKIRAGHLVISEQMTIERYWSRYGPLK